MSEAPELERRMAHALESDDGDEARRQAILRRRMFGAHTAPEQMIGRFTIEERVGAGAVGVVYRARDPGLDRPVAIKVLRAGLADTAGKRMLREARALARLNHPNVVTVFEVGEVKGQPYIAMEYVEGQTLAEWQQGRSPEAIIDAYLSAARGLAMVHRTGLVHRDFKPANILVGNDGRVRVADFGLVRDEGSAVNAPRTAGAAKVAQAKDLTATGGVLGTPAYMAPEQLAVGKADHRSDQFSFCVALYEALAGRRPFASDRPGALLHSIRRGPPPNSNIPSKLTGTLARGLAAAPADRWPDMDALVAALSSRRPGRRWLLAVLTLALVAGIWALASSGGGQHPNQAHIEAVAAAQTKVGTDPSTAALILKELDPTTTGWTEVAREVLSGAVTQVTIRASADFTAVSLTPSDGLSVWRADGLGVSFDGDAEVAASPAAFMSWMTDITSTAQHIALIDLMRAGEIRPGTVLANGALRCLTPTAVLDIDRDGHTTRLPRTVPDPACIAPAGDGILYLPTQGVAQFVPFGPSGPSKPSEIVLPRTDFAKDVSAMQRNAKTAAVGQRDGGIVIWDGATRLLEPKLATPVQQVRLSDTSEWLLATSTKGLSAWHLPDDEPLGVILPGSFNTFAFGFMDNSRAFGARGVGEANVINLHSLRRTPLRGANGEILYIASDGRRLATGESSRTLRLWDLSGPHGTVLGRHPAAIWSASRDSTGRWLATAGLNGVVNLFGLRAGQRTRSLVGHTGNVYFSVFSPDSTLLATGSADGTARLWRLDQPDAPPLVFEGHDGFAYALAFSDDGRWLAVGDRQGGVRLWSTTAPALGRLVGTHPGNDSMRRIHSLTFTADGTKVWSAAKDGLVIGWPTDPDAVSEPVTLPNHGFLSAIVRLATGRLATIAADGVLRTWSPSGAPLASYTSDAGIAGWAHNAAGTHMALSYADGAVLVWDLADQTKPSWGLPKGTVSAEFMTFDTSGTRLVLGDVEGRISVYTLPDVTPAWRFEGHHGAIRHLSFDGDDVISASSDGTVRRWAAPQNPAAMKRLLAERTTDCLDVDQRTAWLGESAVQAAESEARCRTENLQRRRDALAPAAGPRTPSQRSQP
ncbi:MAG: serine/threonine protein kinase/WD40 repeat protein [Myxococcota bacterium]|jgi:serine/threonine protein kinase/WD40 repeat protein